MHSLHPVRASGIPALIALSKEIWLPAFAPLFEKDELMSLYRGMYDVRVLEQWLAKTENHLWFIETAGWKGYAGYLAVEEESDRLKLDKIYVHPYLQGRGVGQWALEQVMEMARKLGHSSLYLRVNRGNVQAIRFYKAAGFTIDEEVDFPAPNGYVYQDYLMSLRMF